LTRLYTPISDAMAKVGAQRIAGATQDQPL
jgi:hypothetical protein